MADDSSHQVPFIGPRNLFDSFASPPTATQLRSEALGTTAGSTSSDTATTVPAGVSEYIRRQIAAGRSSDFTGRLSSDDSELVAFIQQQVELAVSAGTRLPLNRTQQNRKIAAQHIGLQRGDPNYRLPLDALTTDSDLDIFRMTQRDPRFFSSVVWSDAGWCFPPNHVEVLSDNAAAANALNTLVALHPVAYNATPLSEAAILQKRTDLAAYPIPTLSTDSALAFHDSLQWLKDAWDLGRLCSLSDVLGSRLDFLFNMIDKLKHPTLSFYSIDTGYKLGWVLYTQQLDLMLESPNFCAMITELAMKPSLYFNPPAYNTLCEKLMTLALRFKTVPGFTGPMAPAQKAVAACLSTETTRAYVRNLPIQQTFHELCQTLISLKSVLAVLKSAPRPPRSPSDKSRTKDEGLRANLAQGSPPSKQPYKDPPQCLNVTCVTAGTNTKHRMRQCLAACADPACVNPQPHSTRQCPLIYGDGAGAYFQRVTVPSSSSVPTSPSRSHLRRGNSIRTPPIPGQRPIHKNRPIDSSKIAKFPKSAEIGSLPVRLDPSVKIQYDPGATHLFTPKPLDSHAPVIPYRDSLMVADGSHVPIIGKSMLGPVETFIAPSLTHSMRWSRKSRSRL